MYCDYGCGEEAKYILKNKKNCCSKFWSSCPIIKKKNSNGLAQAYADGVRRPAAEVYKDISPDKKKNMQWSKGKTIIPLEDVFKEYGLRTREYTKSIILKEKLMDYHCKECGIDEWRGKPLKLELDHINGIHSDNRLENLRFLCLNCHSQTETYRGRNRNTGKIKVTDVQLADALRNHDAIDKALRSLGLSTGPGNYKRIARVIVQHKIEIKGW